MWDQNRKFSSKRQDVCKYVLSDAYHDSWLYVCFLPIETVMYIIKIYLAIVKYFKGVQYYINDKKIIVQLLYGQNFIMITLCQDFYLSVTDF